MAGRSAQLIIQVLAETQKATGSITAFGKTIDAGMLAKGAAVAGVFVAGTAAIVGMTKAAAEDAAEHERLVGAFEAAGAATGDWSAIVDTAISKGQELAFTDTEIRDAMVPLIGATGDAAKASEALSLAQDVARLSGVDLETAAKAVAKAHAGQGTQLAKLTQQNAKGLTATEVLTAAQKKAAGQAEIYGNTASGQAKAMEIGFSELTEQIGTAFIPIIMAILPALRPLLKMLGELITALLPILIPLLKAVGAVLSLMIGIITRIVRVVIDMVTWIGKAIGVVSDFLASLGPVKAAGDFIGGIFGRAAPAPAPALVPMARGGYAAVPGSVMPTGAGAGTVKLRADVTHHIDDPMGALRGLPGGARAVAELLNRGTDASGLYRSLQHAAGVR